MRRSAVIAGALLVGSTAAWAFPWDIDMTDAVFYRAYEWAMPSLPEGTASRNRYFQNYDRNTPAGQALTNPYPVDDASLAEGRVMFRTYCATCHGSDGRGGSEVTRNDPNAGIRRYPFPAPNLAGPGAISSLRSDGYIYLTIRNGSAIMSGYGKAMDNDEIWSLVAYIRTLDGAQYTPPAPPAPE
jgi:mono/diheme cytochrome c family protein